MAAFAMVSVFALGGLAGEPTGPEPISGAVEAETCQWPTAVNFRTSGPKCTGTLVHPQLVVTAAHCLADGAPKYMRFGEAFTLAELKPEVDFCVGVPEFEPDSIGSKDLAVCKLLDPVTDVPPTPIAMGCEVDAIEPGTAVTIVGFGLGTADDIYGRKRYASTSIVETAPSGAFLIGDSSVSGCLGDSGGPAYLEMPDGSWRVFGVLSGSPPCGDGGASVYAPIHQWVRWIENTSGLDVTPCHDADGSWAPGPACGGFAVDPLDTLAVWANGCASAVSDPGAEQCVAIEGDTGGTEQEPLDPPVASGCGIGQRPARRALWVLALLVIVRRR